MAGVFPVVDDEYAEFIDVLHAVVEYGGGGLSRSGGGHEPQRPFVIVELGARYATWAVRGVQVQIFFCIKDTHTHIYVYSHATVYVSSYCWT